MPPDLGRLVSVRTDALPELDSPAGLICYAHIQLKGENADFVTDDGWVMTELPPPPLISDLTGSNTPESTGADSTPSGLSSPIDWHPVVELGGVDLAPWRIGGKLVELATAPADSLPVRRASLVAATPLTSALGRPNREQIVTVRQETPTTLQALELTNGATVAQLLNEVAKRVVEKSPGEGRTVIEQLYLKCLGRTPTPGERRVAEKLVGSPVRPEGVQDLVWIIAMLPEFQLIR